MKKLWEKLCHLYPKRGPYGGGGGNLGSISSTFYVRLFRTNVLRETFLYLDFRSEFFLAQKYWRKSRAYNVAEIDSWSEQYTKSVTYYKLC
jgi:hypothetical protein